VRLRSVMLDTIVLEEELAVSPIVYAAETSPRARSSKFLIPCPPDLVLERSKRQIPSLESTAPSRTKATRMFLGRGSEVPSYAMYVMDHRMHRMDLALRVSRLSGFGFDRMCTLVEPVESRSPIIRIRHTYFSISSIVV
jgi:hypothetical protein